MLFERRCPRCRRVSRKVCAGCWASLCPAGGLELPGIDRADALFAYDENSRPILLAAKNGGRRDLLTVFGRQLAALLGDQEIDAVTWVPASAERRRRRGYDQGRLLARSVTRELNVRSRPLLGRNDGGSQFGKSGVERRIGPGLRTRGPVPARVLLVDDVVTTGASMVRAAAALRQAGATQIVAVAVAASIKVPDGGGTFYIGAPNASRTQRDGAERSLHGGNGQRSPHDGVGNASAAGSGEDRKARPVSRRHGSR